MRLRLRVIAREARGCVGELLNISNEGIGTSIGPLGWDKIGEKVWLLRLTDNADYLR